MKRALLARCVVVVASVALASAARAADQEAVATAIDRGVAFLRTASPNVNETEQPTGEAALVGWTLLECGVPADDPVVRRALETVRSDAAAMHQTYTLSLSILLLDRLGDPTDEPFIESMTVRLLAGQDNLGGWFYNCPPISDSEVRRLTSLRGQQRELVARRAPAKDDNADGAHPRRTAQDLPKEIQDQLAVLDRQNKAEPMAPNDDNSNTQFAAVALWVARRHGLPVDKALVRIGQRFRSSQKGDGGWPYYYGPDTAGMDSSTASMTCAGLTGLAVSLGPPAESDLEKGKPPPDPVKDRVMKTGLAALGTVIGAPGDKAGGNRTSAAASVGGRSYYFLWSLERVGVVLDVDRIGGKDWYGWGSDILVANQTGDGSWQGDYPPCVDTCFALLFLKKSNVARDLTAGLKGKREDSGERTLKSGSVDDGQSRVGTVRPGVEPKEPAENRVTPRPPSEDTEGGRMAAALLKAPAERRDELLREYRDGKGVAYTEALAGAIPQLSGEDKHKARDLLAERLTRMKADTLAHYFQDQDPEIRRAAALAAAMKEAKTLVPDLIPLLSDPEATVSHAAHAALKDLTGENLGPSEEEWKAWWKNPER